PPPPSPRHAAPAAPAPPRPTGDRSPPPVLWRPLPFLASRERQRPERSSSGHLRLRLADAGELLRGGGMERSARPQSCPSGRTNPPQPPPFTFPNPPPAGSGARKPIRSSSARAGASRRLRIATLSTSARPTWPQASSTRSSDSVGLL